MSHTVRYVKAYFTPEEAIPGLMFVPSFNDIVPESPVLIITKRLVTKVQGGYWEYLCLHSGGTLEWHTYLPYDHIIATPENATGEL